ncbi:amidase domain-containing protein [Thermosipho ferrireducens]|uniref:Amidase domain-containing protein n=1 Tax=Thermosipho ferrireducens TaxID=2571116 RepID=A0ABX7SA09_9BACT|nr:amidase domain-containing protein [Thermosipho ferrireducens]QTA38085.1 amidase domain-containing protein [Thermosipho ferrireducens]
MTFDVSADVLFKYNTKETTFQELEPGDLIFYDLENDGVIDHVALFVKKDEQGVWIWDAVDNVDGKQTNK